ncbi:glycosyltransferase family 32 protein [Belliella marina]|uniref:Glycosyltransferase family 32 protein n=1 Tax=Belliella marina TaxID=1644146 RepID=A0ABW4VTM4_9BACT
MNAKITKLESKSMIPKIIHFCWYGKGEYSETIKKCINSWETLLPEYEIRKWDESNTPFDRMPFLEILYKQKRWAFIADYVRLYAIFKYGGVYLDTDVEVIKPFGSLMDESAFIAFQTEIGLSKYPFNTAVIGCEKGNAFVEACLKETEKLQRMKYHPMAAPNVSSSVLLGKYKINTYKTQRAEHVLVLTKDYFYPFSWTEEYTDDCLTYNTVTIHWWEDSWGNREKDFAYYWRSITRKIERTPLIIKSHVAYWLKKEEDFFHFEK